MALKRIDMQRSEHGQEEDDHQHDLPEEDADRCCGVADPRLTAVMNDKDPDAVEEPDCPECTSTGRSCTCVSELAKKGMEPRRVRVLGAPLKEPRKRAPNHE